MSHATAAAPVNDAKSTLAKPLPDAARKPEAPQAMPARGGCACGGSCPRCQGNTGVGGIAVSSGKPVQAKLHVGRQDDPLEREADDVAARVLGMPAPAPAPPAITALPLRSAAAPAQRSDDGGSGAAMPVADDTAAQIEALQGEGRPLSAADRSFFEPRFARDLSGVRLHDDARAAATADALGARAFTVGNDIAFAARQFQPGSTVGRQLLAHELTHTVQQGAAGAAQVQRQPADLDFADIAARVYKAIDGAGTDEEAVYAALQRLERDPAAIATLEAVYQSTYNLDLRADIDGDFSGGELEYALQLINGGAADADERIERGPNAVVSIATAIERLWDATDRVGTDEEAIFATLVPFNRNTAELEDAFETRYGDNLRATLISEMSDSELDYGLSLLAPEGERRPVVDMISPQVIDANFSPADRDMAGKILRDLIAVRGNRLDFASEQELVDEIRKRLRTSQLMQESQTGTAFGYPESLDAGCPGFTSDIFQQSTAHARVNKDAKPYWLPFETDPNFSYLFRLSPLGRSNAFDALTKLFTNQPSICDRTLIHCDYLITVIHYRTFAEGLGATAFNHLVSSGKLDPVLTYNGFLDPPYDYNQSPVRWSLQEMRPASEDDLVIGDHVIFWNHLAYDAITVMQPGPWRLENALLVDKDASGNDLYEGHGAPEVSPDLIAPGPRDLMLRDLMDVYNGNVRPAVELARQIDAGDTSKQQTMTAMFPRVAKESDGWVIRERDDTPGGRARKKRSYVLRELPNINDPELIGLRDPIDPSLMGTVKRPTESAAGPKALPP